MKTKKPVSKTSRAAAASLSEALNDLERILEKQKPSGERGARGVSKAAPGQQYDIP